MNQSFFGTPEHHEFHKARTALSEALKDGRLTEALRQQRDMRRMAEAMDETYVSLADPSILHERIDRQWGVAAGGPVPPATNDHGYEHRARLLDAGGPMLAIARGDRIGSSIAERRQSEALSVGLRGASSSRPIEESCEQWGGRMDALVALSVRARQERRFVEALDAASDAIDVLRQHCGKTYGESDAEEAYSDVAGAIDEAWNAAALDGLCVQRSGKLSLISTESHDGDMTTWLTASPLEVPPVREQKNAAKWHINRLARAGLIAEGSAAVVAYGELYANVPHVSADASSIDGAERLSLVRAAVEAGLLRWIDAGYWWGLAEDGGTSDEDGIDDF